MLRIHFLCSNHSLAFCSFVDSYGTLDLNGRAEILLGQFENRYQEEIISESGNKEKNWWDFGSKDGVDADSNRQQVATKLAPVGSRQRNAYLFTSSPRMLTRFFFDSLLIVSLACDARTNS